MSSQLEAVILEEVHSLFPQYQTRLSRDPEAEDVISIEVFDVPEDNRMLISSIIWEIIDSIEDSVAEEDEKRILFMPSIITHSKTVEFYPELVRKL